MRKSIKGLTSSGGTMRAGGGQTANIINKKITEEGDECPEERKTQGRVRKTGWWREGCQHGADSPAGPLPWEPEASQEREVRDFVSCVPGASALLPDERKGAWGRRKEEFILTGTWRHSV